MESEVLSEQIEFEARRVAAAFGIEKFSQRFIVDAFYYKANLGLLWFAWHIHGLTGHLTQIDVGQGRPSCIVAVKEGGPGECHPHYSRPECNERMVRGLYCLGIEDEVALAPLNYQLTAHEKLELRLSMPREFWPRKWLDEENSAAQS